MTPDEIVKDCWCNPWMIGTVMMIDYAIWITQQLLIAHAYLHKGDWSDA